MVICEGGRGLKIEGHGEDARMKKPVPTNMPSDQRIEILCQSSWLSTPPILARSVTLPSVIFVYVDPVILVVG